jgi:hypothetical protein
VIEAYLGVGAFSGEVGAGSPQKMRQTNES